MRTEWVELRNTLFAQCDSLRSIRDRFDGQLNQQAHVVFMERNLSNLAEYAQYIDNYLADRSHSARQSDADNLALTQGRQASEQANKIIADAWKELKAIGR